MDRRPKDTNQAMEWLLPHGVCCPEAQADGVPCHELDVDCLTCDRGDDTRKVMLRLAMAQWGLQRHVH